VCLVIDDETLRRRLAARTTNEFGKQPGELEAALARNQDAEAQYRNFGVTTIDATRPLDAVVRDVLTVAGLATRS
jgi:ribose 1,5-bisphosphokinase PhnN